MRVALVDPSEFSPPYDAALARGLVAAGHRVTVIGEAGGVLAGEPGLDHAGHFYRPLARGLGRRLSGRAVRLAKGALHAVDLWRLPARLSALEVELIHLQWAPIPLLDGSFLQRLRRVAPIVFTAHDTVPYNGAEPWLMAAGMARLSKAVDAVICHTEQGRRRLLRQGLPADRLHVVPHGLLGRRLDTEPAPADRIRLLQFGQIKPYKGIDVLLEALGLLTAAERARLRVQIVGKPHHDPAPLVARAKRLGLDACVTFEFGFVPEARVDALFADTDALLFPYRDIEASGVLMQAVAAGLPVVASRIGAFAELLEHGRQGLLVPAGDPPSLAAALRLLATEPEALSAMRGEMRRLRDRLPDWAAIGEQTTAVYAAARANHAGTRPVGVNALGSQRQSRGVT
jgi:glycosyltransferase involved in cell wall biosynthesis